MRCAFCSVKRPAAMELQVVSYGIPRQWLAALTATIQQLVSRSWVPALTRAPCAVQMGCRAMCPEWHPRRTPAHDQAARCLMPQPGGACDPCFQREPPLKESILSSQCFTPAMGDPVCCADGLSRNASRVASEADPSTRPGSPVPDAAARGGLRSTPPKGAASERIHTLITMLHASYG